jgi:type VI secretion system secreted protein Hcp
MAVDMFIKIDGVKGEAHDDKHKDEIDVLAWSWGASNSGSMSTGGGGGSGKVNVQDISITKYVDKSSPLLLGRCCQGAHISTATLTVRKAGTNPLEYIKLTLSEILVSSISTGGSGGADRLTENITLNFAKFKIEYTPQKADGSAEGAVPYAYDLKANKPC